MLLVSVSTAEIHASRSVLEARGSLILGITIVLVLIFGLWMSGVLVRPFQKITDGIEGISDGFENESLQILTITPRRS